MGVKSFLKDCSLGRDLLLFRAKMRFGGNGRQIHTFQIARDAVLGKGVRLDEGVVIQSGVSVGDYTYLRLGSKIWHRSTVGKYCSIGENVLIGAPEHPLKFISTSPIVYQKAQQPTMTYWPIDDIRMPCNIGNDVWIGNNAVIASKGDSSIVVGDGAVIGAGAIVTKSIPSYSIAVGVPAKVIGYRFDPDTIEAISDLSWWDWDLGHIIQNPEFVFNPTSYKAADHAKSMQKEHINEDGRICSDKA